MIQVRSVKPKTKFKSSIFRDELRAEAEAVRDDMFKDFDKTVKTWRKKPTFGGGVKIEAGQIKVEIKTDDKIYIYVDQGTRPHIIRPRKAKALRFWSQYQAKTRPGWIGSRAGGVGGELLYRPEVHHPGTEAREFTQTIHDKWKPEWQRRMKNAMARATRRSGHGKD